MKSLAAVLMLALSAHHAAATPLHDAAKAGNAAAISALLAAGADPNAKDKNGETPLHTAASRGHTAAISALLAAGADPNERY